MEYIKEKLNNAWNWTKDKAVRFKKAIVALVIIPTAFAATVAVLPEETITLEDPQVVTWTKPLTDQEWADDVKKESLELKFDYQLTQMKENLETKLPFHEKDLEQITLYPDSIRWELQQDFESMFDGEGVAYNKKLEGKTIQQWIDEEFISQTAQKNWEVEKVKQSIERIDNEKRLRSKGFVSIIEKIPAGDKARLSLGNTRSPLGTTYYVDADCATPGDGTTATCDGDADDSYSVLDSFTEASRSAGDDVIVRRGTTATIDNGSDLFFNSDGTVASPIKITADYTDEWGDFASSTQTYTPVYGTKTMTASVTITGISANDWMFIQGDDHQLFSYEVLSVSGTTLTLYLPYKGDQSGSGNTLNVMPAAPIWGSPTFNFQWNFDNDLFWQVRGIHVSGTDAQGQIELDSVITDGSAHLFSDMIFVGNDSTAEGLACQDGGCQAYMNKTRFLDETSAIRADTADALFIILSDILVDSSNDALNNNSVNSSLLVDAKDFEITNGGTEAFSLLNSSQIYCRNCSSNGGIITFDNNDVLGTKVHLDDDGGTLGDTRSYRQKYGSFNALREEYKTSTTTVRSGGGSTSLAVNVTDNQQGGSILWGDLFKFKLVEYPIYADTTSKTYTFYFKSADTTAWVASPTSDELYVECEYLTSGSPIIRQTIKSTGSVDFTTDTDFDQSLSVTCQPSVTGILYLRVIYGKPGEGGTDYNSFYVDIEPEIS